MHTGFAPATYHEPDRLDLEPVRSNPTKPNKSCERSMLLKTVSTAIMTVYTLQMLHNFTHRLVISSLAKWLKVSILPNVHFLWCTARRSPQSFWQRFPAHKIFRLRFHHCGICIQKRPPLVPRLGDKPTLSPKSRKSHSALLPWISTKLGKQHATPLSLTISALWLHGKHGYMLHEHVLRVTTRHYHNPK
jgi:hypothetical protein